jgi:DNA-binding CsgD family transcriptional regulator
MHEQWNRAVRDIAPDRSRGPHRNLVETALLTPAYRHALDELAHGVIFADTDLNVRARNTRASRLLNGESGLSLRHGRLHCPDRASEHHVQAAAAQVLRDGGKVLISSVATEDSAQSLLLRITALPPEEAPPGTRLMIFIHETPPSLSISERHLREIYAMTDAEARLTARLVEGIPLDAAAGTMGISQNTARSYLKRIFIKVGVNRQIDLARMLLPLALLTVRMSGSEA